MRPVEFDRPSVPASSAKVFHDVKPGIVVGAIDYTVAVHEYVGRLHDARPVGAMVDEPARGRLDQSSGRRRDFDRRVSTRTSLHVL